MTAKITDKTNMTGEKSTLTFWSGVGTVTGANFMLKKGSATILVDCGLVQGELGAGDRNREPFPYNPSSVDTLFVTHAHIDHIGRVPKLIKDGFRGVIYSTRETKAIATLMFDDAMKFFGHADQALGESLYEKIHVEQALALWKEIPYHQKFDCVLGLTAELLDAGHILGSAMVRLTGGTYGSNAGKNIVFTGDTGNSPAPIIKNMDTITDADYLVIDSVYGDRKHEPKDERDRHFEQIVRTAIEKKGTLVIPAFSLDRTQILLYELNNLIEEGKIPSVPVFLDSPLAIKLTVVYRDSSKYFNQGVQKEIREGDDIFNFPKLKTTFAPDRSHMIERTPSPKIIIAGSGMSAGGRVMGHEITYLPDANNTVLLTG